MSIKNRYITFLTLVILVQPIVWNLSCSREKQPAVIIPNVELKGSRCINGAILNFKLLVSGLSTEEQATQIWPCFTNVLQTFKTYVEGDNKGYFKPEEVRLFVENYFLKDSKNVNSSDNLISDELLNELMGIKVLFLGGSRTELTQKEIDLTFTLINEFNSITKNIWPHAEIIFAKAHDPNFQRFDEAMISLENALQAIAKQVKPSKTPYQLSSFKNLLEQLSLFFSKIDHDSTTTFDWGKYVPLLAQAKSLLLNSRIDVIENADWSLIGKLVGRTFKAGLNYHYYFTSNVFETKSSFLNLDRFVSSVLVIISDGFTKRQNKPFAQAEVVGVLNELNTLKYLPLNLNADAMSKLWLLITDGVLNPQQKFPAVGLSLDKYNYLLTEYRSWIKVQNLLFDKREDISDPRWNEMKSIISTPWPISLDDKNRVVLDGSSQPTNSAAATRLNWTRAVFAALYKSYISDPSRLYEMKLSKAELNKAYVDLKPLLVGIGLIGPGDNTFDTKIFRDANLFMPVSDGDMFLGFREVVQYLHFALSGIDAGKWFVSIIPESCKIEKQMNIQCFRQGFMTESPRALQHLPFYLKYSSQLNYDKWMKDILSIEKINRKNGAIEGPIEFSEIYESFGLLQYLEVIMLRFDVNRSGDLDLVESLHMLKLFRNVLSNLLKMNPDKDAEEIEALFTYMIKYGELPDPNDPLIQIKFNNWKWQKANWFLKADRGDLLKILSILQKLSK